MKRPIAICLAILAATLSGCGERASEAPRSGPAGDGWVMAPIIDAVRVDGRDVVLSGRATPLGRVVVSGAGGLAFAAGADAEGRFDLRVTRPTRDMVFAVEARVGQRGYPAPGRLLIGAASAGPIALLTIGSPTRRLDAVSGPLDAVDDDGRSRLLSGRTTPGGEIRIGPAQTQVATAGSDGRWTLAAAAGLTSVRIGATTYGLPPAAAFDGVLERTAGGWRFGMTTADGARQSTWFPDP